VRGGAGKGGLGGFRVKLLFQWRQEKGLTQSAGKRKRSSENIARKVVFGGDFLQATGTSWPRQERRTVMEGRWRITSRFSRTTFLSRQGRPSPLDNPFPPTKISEMTSYSSSVKRGVPERPARENAERGGPGSEAVICKGRRVSISE